MIPVIIESPFAGNQKLNKEYARMAMLDCLARGESPFASHLLYTQVLDDNALYQREMGIEAGFVWASYAHKVVVYKDLGISKGMELGIKRAERFGQAVEYRSIPRFKKQNKNL